MTVSRTHDRHRGLIRVKIVALKVSESAGRVLIISVVGFERADSHLCRACNVKLSL